MGLAGGLMGRAGDDTAAVFEVRGEHAVVSGEMGAGAWHEGGEAGDEFDGVEHDMSRPVTEGMLESIHDLPAVIDREAFVGDRWAGDVAAQAFEGVALMGLAARAGMEGESRELGDAGVVGERVGRDGAQGQGLAPGVGAGGDAVVDGGTEESLESVVGFVRLRTNRGAQCPQRTEIRRLSAPSGMAGRSAPWPVGTVTGRSPPSIGASVSCSGRALRHHLDRPAVNAQPCSEPIDRKPLTQPPQRRSAEPRGNRRIPEPMPMTPAHRRNRASKRRRSSPHPRTHPRKPHRNAHAGNQSTSCPVDRP